MLYEIGSNGMVPLSSAGKDNLEIGRVILFNGYNNESYDAIAIELGFVSAKFNDKTGCFDGVDYETTEMIRRAAWKKDFYTNGGIAA